MTYILYIPKNYPYKQRVREAIQDSNLDYRITDETETDFIQLCNGLISFIGTAAVFSAISKASSHDN